MKIAESTGALAASILFAIVGFTGCSKQSASASASAPPSGTVAQNGAGTSSATAQNRPDDKIITVCYQSAALDVASGEGSATPQARKEVAERMTKVADKDFGPGVVFVSVAGTDDGKVINDLLLVAVAPRNEKSLRVFGANLLDTNRMRGKLCADGFDQVRLIVRADDGVNERLVKRADLIP